VFSVGDTYGAILPDRCNEIEQKWAAQYPDITGTDTASQTQYTDVIDEIYNTKFKGTEATDEDAKDFISNVQDTLMFKAYAKAKGISLGTSTPANPATSGGIISRGIGGLSSALGSLFGSPTKALPAEDSKKTAYDAKAQGYLQIVTDEIVDFKKNGVDGTDNGPLYDFVSAIYTQDPADADFDKMLEDRKLLKKRKGKMTLDWIDDDDGYLFGGALQVTVVGHKYLLQLYHRMQAENKTAAQAMVDFDPKVDYYQTVRTLGGFGRNKQTVVKKAGRRAPAKKAGKKPPAKKTISKNKLMEIAKILKKYS